MGSWCQLPRAPLRTIGLEKLGRHCSLDNPLSFKNLVPSCPKALQSTLP